MKNFQSQMLGLFRVHVPTHSMPDRIRHSWVHPEEEIPIVMEQVEKRGHSNHYRHIVTRDWVATTKYNLSSSADSSAEWGKFRIRGNVEQAEQELMRLYLKYQ